MTRAPVMRALLRQLAYLAGYGTLGILLTLTIGFAIHIANGPALMPWHVAHLEAEFRAANAPEFKSLDDYRTLEAKLMAQLDAEVYAQVPRDQRRAVNRYFAGSLADARRHTPNWNLTFEMPVAQPKGAVLLLHGLTDSPYSMRALAEIFAARGWYVVGLRLPGHGTAPVALTRVTWQDWAAATRLATKHLRAKTGPDVPLVIAGYSTGAALAIEYALATLQGESLPRASGLVLLSPAIGVSPVAAFAAWPARIARWTGWEKLAWTDTPPEFDPYKYNGFTANAADQVYQLTRRIREQIAALVKPGGVSGMPPVLAFQSVADATVSSTAVVDELFAKLAPEGHALVAFDINRDPELEPLLSPAAKTVSRDLLNGPPLPFDLTILGNAEDAEHRQRDSTLVARHRAAAGMTVDTRTIELIWPRDTYSLSHVALPFRADDAVYGATPPSRRDFMFLGRVELYGERGVLAIPAGTFARLRYNPFFPYIESRLSEYLTAGLQQPMANSVPSGTQAASNSR
jgi:alpha-beta hydrolase superfamily lysophospholipase